MFYTLHILSVLLKYGQKCTYASEHITCEYMKI
jgi:hypothetical protein